MSNDIPGGESIRLNKASERVGDLVRDIRYAEGATGFHLDTGNDSLEEGIELVHIQRAGEYTGKIVFSALINMGILPQDLEGIDLDQFKAEVDRIGDEMHIRRLFRKEQNASS